MKYFTTSELVKSLAVPVFTFGIGAVAQLGHIMNDSGFNGIDSTFIFSLMLMLLGGVLPMLMTLFGHVHTERYFVKRIILIPAVWLISNLVNGFCQSNAIIATLSGDGSLLQFTLQFVFFVAELLFLILKIWDEYTSGGERAVTILSDPYLWLFIDTIYSFAFDVWFKTT